MKPCKNKFEERTNRKKESIIESALTLFREKGFTETSIKEIAEKAQVSQVSIYNYFGSKDALVIECARILSKDSLENAKALMDSGLPYMEKLETALSSCSTELNASLTRYLSSSAKADNNFMKLLSDSVLELQTELYLRYIELGKQEGYIDPSYPDSLILRFIKAFNTIEISPDDYIHELNLLHHFFLHGVITL